MRLSDTQRLITGKVAPLGDFGRLLRKHNVDGPLLGGILLICGLGLVVLYSAVGESTRLLVNPGIEKVRLRSPVHAGQRVRMRATVTKVREIKGGAARASLHLVFEAEGEKRPAAFGDVLVVLYP